MADTETGGEGEAADGDGKAHADLLWVRGRVGLPGRIVLGLYLIAIPLSLIVMVVKLWPHALAVNAEALAVRPLTPEWAHDLQPEQALITTIALLGALGGALHALSSFTAFVGNRRLVRSWFWWYVARAPIGAALAVIMYFLLRAGLLTNGGADGKLNPYGMAAIGLMSGLSSEIALQKVREVFEVLFRPKEQRKDGLDGHAPEIHAIAPDRADVGAGDTVVKISGSSFLRGDQVFAKGTALVTSFVSEQEVDATLPKELLASAGEVPIEVHRIQPRPMTSNPLSFKVTAKPAG